MIHKNIWNWTQKRKRKKNWIGFFYLYKLQIFYSYFSFQFNQTNKGKKKVFSITSTKPFSLFCSYLTSFTQRRARNLFLSRLLYRDARIWLRAQTRLVGEEKRKVPTSCHVTILFPIPTCPFIGMPKPNRTKRPMKKHGWKGPGGWVKLPVS